MPNARALTVCSKPGCHEFTDAGRCATHRAAADRARGTAAERGYSGRGWRASRRATLRRDGTCVLCHAAPATVADHWPLGRRELVEQGVSDPDAPHRLRGLCASCHGVETAREQPGGWNRR